VYDSSGNARKRVDLVGRPHNGVPTPHVVDYVVDTTPNGQQFPKQDKGSVRAATPDELPC
jgi:hypothetical protein